MRRYLLGVTLVILVAVAACSSGSAADQAATKGSTSNPTGQASGQTVVDLKPVADGLTAPLALIPPGDGSGRLFVVDQIGLIRVLSASGELLSQPFLDLRDRMVTLQPGYDERGLLGLAFHPDYAKDGRLFVYYSAPLRAGAPSGWNNTSHISEFHVSSTDPNQADPSSERIILQVDEPEANHNAGQITFGPDGYLYIPLGDGGGANDVGLGHPPMGNGQDTSTLLGSILRIDVDGSTPYSVPKDNPFVGGAGRDEIFAYGLRNPYHISFDAGGDHALYAGDAGQNRWEEVDLVVKGGNYGWNIREGTHCFDPQRPDNPPATCPDTGANGAPLIDPIIQYENAHAPGGLGFVVIGGYIYRGSALPGLVGRYVFGDWSDNESVGNGTLLVATRPSSSGGLWPLQRLDVVGHPNGRLGEFVRSFGQDAQHELYVLTSERAGPSGNTGKVYKIVPSSSP